MSLGDSPLCSNTNTCSTSDSDRHSHSHSHGHSDSHGHSHSHGHGHSHSHGVGHSHSHGHGHSHSHGGGHSHSHGHGHSHHHHEDSHATKAGLGLFFGMALLAIEFLGIPISISAGYVINVLSILMTIYLGKNLYQSAIQSIRTKQIGTELLYTISTLTILGLSIYSLIFSSAPLLIESAPLILGFWHLGEVIEDSLINKINKNLDVRDCAPKLVYIYRKKELIQIPREELVPNNVVEISPGDVIPVDGELLSDAQLYTTRINGSPNINGFKIGSLVKSGMELPTWHKKISVRATESFQNSYLSIVAKNIESAKKEQAPIEVFTNKLLKYFIPSLIGVAIVSGITIGMVHGTALATQSVLSILVSACPCALSLITPMAVRLGMKKASDNGIHFKHGKALQAAANIDAVVFDLNGTLTRGEHAISEFHIKHKRLLPYFALLESNSQHPFAKIIVDHIQKQKPKAISKRDVTEIDKRHHSGIKGVVNNKTIMIGNSEMLRANNIQMPNKKSLAGSTIYMVYDKKIVGTILIYDRLRDDAKITVDYLKIIGKDVYICTGADNDTAAYYGNLLGVQRDKIRANTVGAATNEDNESIEDKVSKESFIKTLQQNGHKVAMVGDAVNDLAAFARSEVGVAVKSTIGDKTTESHAGVYIDDSLYSLVTALDVSAKTKKNIYQNLVVSLTYNSIITLVGTGLFISQGLVLSPSVGVIFMMLESTIILANLFRFKTQKVLAQPINNLETSNTNIPVLDSKHRKITNVNKPKPDLSKIAREANETSTSQDSILVLKEGLAQNQNRLMLKD